MPRGALPFSKAGERRLCRPEIGVSPECRQEDGVAGGRDRCLRPGVRLMCRIATVSALVALLVGLPLVEALAQGCCRPGRRAYLYAPPPLRSPYQAWLAYYR